MLFRATPVVLILPGLARSISLMAAAATGAVGAVTVVAQAATIIATATKVPVAGTAGAGGRHITIAAGAGNGPAIVGSGPTTSRLTIILN